MPNLIKIEGLIYYIKIQKSMKKNRNSRRLESILDKESCFHYAPGWYWNYIPGKVY
jgi:hypothetical protein